MTRSQAVIEHTRLVLDALQDAIILCKECPAAPVRHDVRAVAECQARKLDQLERARKAGLEV